MNPLDDEITAEPLLSLSLEYDDANISNSNSKIGSSCSTSSTKSTLKKNFNKHFNVASTSVSFDKRQLMKKKSQSYQDLHLPSVRRRYSNVQSKVKQYIESIQPPAVPNNKRTPLLRHKSMPETYQNMLQEDDSKNFSLDMMKRKLDSVQTKITELEELKCVLERDLESEKFENILLARKVDAMRITIAELKAKKNPSMSNLSVARQETSQCAVATQTMEINRLAYELSTTVSPKSFVDAESICANRILVQDSLIEVNTIKNVKKTSKIRKRFQKIFSCMH